MKMIYVAATIFATIFLLTLILFVVARDRLARRNRRLRQRLRNVLEGGAMNEEAGGYLLLRDTSYSRIPFLDRLLGQLRFARRLQRLIDEAGLPIKAGTLLLSMLSAAGFTWLIVGSVLGRELVGAAAAAVAGSIPYFWVLRKRRKRIDRFEELLPEAIDLVVNALRSGFSLEASLSLVAQEIPEPLGTEFAMTFEEQNLGLELSQALENMNERIPSEDLRILTTAITIQKKSGGNLTEVLERIGEMIRERLSLRREIRIFTAQGRLSGMILAVLPIALALILSFLSPGYMTIMFTDPAGQYLIGTAVILQILGYIFIRRIVRLKY